MKDLFMEVCVYVGFGYVLRCKGDMEQVKIFYEYQLVLVVKFKDWVIEGCVFFNLGIIF